MPITGIEARLAVVEVTVSEIDQEVKRTRERMHDLESDRVAVNLLSERLKYLTERLDGVKAEVANIRVELGSFRRTVVAFAFSITGSAIIAFFAVLVGTGRI